MKKSFVTFCLLACLLVGSCAFLDTETDNLPIEFELSNMNQQIKLFAIEEMNTFRIDYPVRLFLAYNAQMSDAEIVFAPNFNLRIFIQKNGKWVEIKEKPVVRADENVFLSPASNKQLVTFFPDLPDVAQTYSMRVYVFGDMDSADGTKQVAAFVDFVLAP